MSDGPLLVERRDHVLVLRMNRPESRNAVDFALSRALADAWDELEQDDDLSVAVLAGHPDFSTGMDLKGFSRGDSIEIEGRGLAGLTRRPPAKPVVAAVEGYALAGGFEMVLACDLVVAGASSRFGLPEVRRGLVAGSGGLLRLAGRVPPAVVSGMALTGRMVGAAEAARWGLVTEVVEEGEATERALELATEIADSSPTALRATKEILRAGMEECHEDAWRIQDATLGDVLSSDDAAEGAQAFLERRQPRWRRR